MAGGAAFELLVGLDGKVTEPLALERVFALSRANPRVSMYCFAALKGSATYHPKLYLMRNDQRVSCVVGSSNLTDGGLRKNVEVNLLLDCAVDDEFVSDLYATYYRLKFHQNRTIPDEQLLSLYDDLYRKRERREDAERAAPKEYRAFADKVRTLPRPVPTRRDLFGWLELIYDALPAGEFENSDVYTHEGEFGIRFPGNRNVRAKVRQQLQLLRDIGLVEHVAAGRWRKL